jgi:hypothetical protein
MIPGSMIATRSFIPWDRLSDAGNWVVVLFGFLLCAICLFSLFALGMRAIFAPRHKSPRHKRRRQAKQCV